MSKTRIYICPECKEKAKAKGIDYIIISKEKYAFSDYELIKVEDGIRNITYFSP